MHILGCKADHDANLSGYSGRKDGVRCLMQRFGFLLHGRKASSWARSSTAGSTVVLVGGMYSGHFGPGKGCGPAFLRVWMT